MTRDLDRLIEIVLNEKELGMGPVLRQALANRLEHPPTEGELERARAQVMGRTPADALG